MSGGVGPCQDIGTLEEEKELVKEIEEEHPPDPLVTQTKTYQATTHRRFFSFRQLNALAVVVVFSSSGMVAPADFAFVVLSLLYILFLSKFVFPPNTPTPEPGEKNRLLHLYVFAGSVVGLFLPIAYIFEGVLEGDEGIKNATPHVFLFSSQMFLEGVFFSGNFSLPIRAFLKVVYNAKRLAAITDWLMNEFAVDEKEHGSGRRLHVGRGLAVANLFFWSVNLLVFLVPVYLPKAFEKYYGCKEKSR